MINISKQWYKDKLTEYINSKCGGVSSLKPGNTMDDGELISQMYKELTRKYNPAPNEVAQLIKENKEMFAVCRNEMI